ncbi:hypothetical protein [Glutamicibacter arilaitensis]
MTEKFDIQERWPELFTQLDAIQRNAIRQALAADPPRTIRDVVRHAFVGE